MLTGSGYVVTGERYISLGVRVPSRIERYLVEEGEVVKAGQALVQLDARQYDAALAAGAREPAPRARQPRAPAQGAGARAASCSSTNVLSQADLDVKQNQLRVAEAEVAQLVAAHRAPRSTSKTP